MFLLGERNCLLLQNSLHIPKITYTQNKNEVKDAKPQRTKKVMSYYKTVRFVISSLSRYVRHNNIQRREGQHCRHAKCWYGNKGIHILMDKWSQSALYCCSIHLFDTAPPDQPSQLGLAVFMEAPGLPMCVCVVVCVCLWGPSSPFGRSSTTALKKKNQTAKFDD